jgi:hypothetical protein
MTTDFAQMLIGDPAWFFNLVANPEVTVEAAGETFEAVPPRQAATNGIDSGRCTCRSGRQKQTERKFPMIVLMRMADGTSDQRPSIADLHPERGSPSGRDALFPAANARITKESSNVCAKAPRLPGPQWIRLRRRGAHSSRARVLHRQPIPAGNRRR